MTRSVTTTFESTRGGEAPLTWGQLTMSLAMSRNQQQFNLGATMDLTDLQVGVEVVVDAIGRLMARHESLHTLIRGEGGEARQVVIPAGSLSISVEECPEDEADARAISLYERQLAVPFEFGTELPIRAGLVTADDGSVRYAVLTFPHLFIDGSALQVIRDDVRDVLAHGEFRGEPGLQPIDLARDQQRSGPATTARSVTYWTHNLRRIRPTTLGPVRAEGERQFREAHLDSPALQAAVKRLADLHRTSPAAVLVSATVLILGNWTDNSCVALNIPVANRFRSQHRKVTSTLVQQGLLVVDLPAGATLDELIPLTAAALLRTYRFAYYDPAELNRERRAIDAERGQEINPLCCFNAIDTEYARPDELDRWTAQDILAGRERSRLSWSEEAMRPRCRFCLRVLPATMRHPQSLALTANTAYLPPARIEQFLRETEDHILTAATLPRSRLNTAAVGEGQS